MMQGTKAQHSDAKARELQAEEGSDCTIIIQLPNGDQHTHKFKLGVTVAYAKLQIEQLYSIPMTQQKLTCNGKTLIDPLSLSDCPGISAEGSSLVLVEQRQQ
eukprot:GHUV01048658.1.p2 GENE.GHUV01048658.1~~GHUV01048658.1.p2  ORF type:complete len:102 (+),score=18.88 GHUV01048658.1:314-619(+)